MPTRVAVMQPYFLPYAGYFRLFATTDVFVLYDCVQFIRGGWIHRNRLVDANGRRGWFTLPLVKCPRETLIRDMRFPDDTGESIAARARPFPALRSTRPELQELLSAVFSPGERLVPYLQETLIKTCQTLGLACEIVRSSRLESPSAVSFNRVRNSPYVFTCADSMIPSCLSFSGSLPWWERL